MSVCCCMLAGTAACHTCPNNYREPSEYIIIMRRFDAIHDQRETRLQKGVTLGTYKTAEEAKNIIKSIGNASKTQSIFVS